MAAGLRDAFQQPDQDAARAALKHLAEQLHKRRPKLTGVIEGMSDDVLAYPLRQRVLQPGSCGPRPPGGTAESAFVCLKLGKAAERVSSSEQPQRCVIELRDRSFVASDALKAAPGRKRVLRDRFRPGA